MNFHQFQPEFLFCFLIQSKYRAIHFHSSRINHWNNPSKTDAWAANIFKVSTAIKGYLKHNTPLETPIQVLYKIQDRDSPQWQINLYMQFHFFKLASINTCNRSACEYPSSAISQNGFSIFSDCYRTIFSWSFDVKNIGQYFSINFKLFNGKVQL
jgi:hypothetical protein